MLCILYGLLTMVFFFEISDLTLIPQLIQNSQYSVGQRTACGNWKHCKNTPKLAYQWNDKVPLNVGLKTPHQNVLDLDLMA